MFTHSSLVTASSCSGSLGSKLLVCLQVPTKNTTVGQIFARAVGDKSEFILGVNGVKTVPCTHQQIHNITPAWS